VKGIGTYAGRPVSVALPVFRGCGAPAQKCLEGGGSLDAQAALQQALQRGTLDVVALGPLSNLAALLAREPGLASRITRVIAVMGRRPGHRFHPSENRATGAMLFGHGPIFRDLNAVLDPQAVSVVLASGIPLVLVPYTAARQVSLTGGDLDRIARSGPAGRWVAERSRAWLEFWRSEAGLDGFYPFDLMAAAYVRDPTHFGCARVTAWVGEDALLPWFGGGPALLVAQLTGLPTSSTATAQALYCDVVRVQVDELFL
jgi:inosine-uridine nucleoside N-ribohydrolase